MLNLLRDIKEKIEKKGSEIKDFFCGFFVNRGGFMCSFVCDSSDKVSPVSHSSNDQTLMMEVINHLPQIFAYCSEVFTGKFKDFSTLDNSGVESSHVKNKLSLFEGQSNFWGYIRRDLGLWIFREEGYDLCDRIDGSLLFLKRNVCVIDKVYKSVIEAVGTSYGSLIVNLCSWGNCNACGTRFKNGMSINNSASFLLTVAAFEFK